MIGDADEKTYEFGMLRALGFGKRWLIALLTIQALNYSISGIIIGLVSSYIIGIYGIFMLLLGTISYNISKYIIISYDLRYNFDYRRYWSNIFS
jgi:ABC-type antimicrobial peptide transport system permease subunit